MVADISLWILWFPVRFVVWIVPLGFGIKIGRCLGSLLGVINSGRRRATYNELFLLRLDGVDKKGIEKIVSRSCQLLGMSQVEVMLFPKMNRPFLDKLVPQQRIVELDKALGNGRGVILLVAHFGSNRIVLPVLGHRGYKVIQLGAPANIWKTITPDEVSRIRGRVLDLEHEFEQKLPVEFIFGNMAMRGVLKALKANKVVVVAADGRGGDKWAEVEFFGRKALFSLMPVMLAQKTGAALLPTFAIRRFNIYQELVIDQPIECGKESDPEKIIANYVKILESYVRRYPCHYAEFLRFMGMRAAKGDIPLFKDRGAIE